MAGWWLAGGWLVAARWSEWDEFLEFLTSKRLKPRILRCVVVQNLVVYEVFEGSICTTLEPFGQKSMERAVPNRGPKGRPNRGKREP